MTKFIEIYFHFIGQITVRRYIINVDTIDRIEENKYARVAPDKSIKVYTECILVTKDGTRYILEQRIKEKTIKRLLEL